VLYSYDQIGCHANKAHNLTLADYRAGYLPSGPSSNNLSSGPGTSTALRSAAPPPTGSAEKVIAKALPKVAPALVSAKAKVPQVQTKAEVPSEGEEPERMCLAQCRVCREEFAHELIRGHLADKHGITDKYWDQYLFSRKTYYRYHTVYHQWRRFCNYF
jgi:hypothetical protein